MYSSHNVARQMFDVQQRKIQADLNHAISKVLLPYLRLGWEAYLEYEKLQDEERSRIVATVLSPAQRILSQIRTISHGEWPVPCVLIALREGQNHGHPENRLPDEGGFPL